MQRLRALGLSFLILAVGAGTAAAADRVDEALGTVMTLLAVAVLLWVIGSVLTYHRYDAGGPKGGPLPKH